MFPQAFKKRQAHQEGGFACHAPSLRSPSENLNDQVMGESRDGA